MSGDATACPDCYAAEHPVRNLFNGIMAAVAVHQILAPGLASAVVLRDLGGVMGAALGESARPLTPYEVHREAWVRTGDVAELERMNRHVRQEGTP
jgi:hypothetical protein